MFVIRLAVGIVITFDAFVFDVTKLMFFAAVHAVLCCAFSHALVEYSALALLFARCAVHGGASKLQAPIVKFNASADKKPIYVFTQNSFGE